MPTEIELKFVIAHTEIAKLAKLSLIQQYSQQESSLKMQNTYLDTPDLELKRRGYALRIRKYDGHILQTLKTDQKINKSSPYGENKVPSSRGLTAGSRKNKDLTLDPAVKPRDDNNALSERHEWEHEIEQEKINPDKFPMEIQDWLKPLVPKLKPIFTTDFTRQIWLLKLEDQTVIELALDQGEIRAGDHTSPFCEIELELKQGNLENLKAFARKLQKDIKLTPEKSSKAERGYKIINKV